MFFEGWIRVDIFIDYYVLQEPFEDEMDKIKPDGSYWGGGEFATMNLVLNLRELGHHVDYRVPTKSVYQLGIIIKQPMLILRKELAHVAFRKLWLWTVDNMSLALFQPFLKVKKGNPYHGIVVPFEPLDQLYGQLPLKRYNLKLVKTSNMIQPIEIPEVNPWESPSICYVGAFNSLKMADFALMVMGEFCKRHPEFKAHAYGSASLWVHKEKDEGLFQQSCEALIERYDIVYHHNLPYTTVRSCYAEHLATLCPGAHGLVALESMWCGTPVLYSEPLINPLSFSQLYIGAGTADYVGAAGFPLKNTVKAWVDELEYLLCSTEQIWEDWTIEARSRATGYLWENVLPDLIEELCQ